MTDDTEERALAALAEQERTTRQEPQPEDRRLARAREAADMLGDQTYGVTTVGLAVVRDVILDLVAFAEERLLVNRGLIAAAKKTLDVAEPLNLLTNVSDADLLTELVSRGNVGIVSRA